MNTYSFIMKMKKNFVYEMVNNGQVNKGQVDNFVKCQTGSSVKNFL